MASTKSRFEMSEPGAKKRISMRFSPMKPGTAGTTSGRSMRETMHSAGLAWPAV